MLRDHEPGDWHTDQFRLAEDAQGNPQFTAQLCFPCCCCVHGTQPQEADPCYRCGHNANSRAANLPYRP